MTSALQCPVGDVMDVSREGFRLSSYKRLKLKPGEVHQFVLRTGTQQIRVQARVQWVKLATFLPMRWEAGFLIVDGRRGVGEAVLQLGQYGCAGVTADDADKINSAGAPNDGVMKAEMEIEDLYAVLGVEPESGEQEIKAAYRKLAQTVHPDYSDEPDAAARFDRVAKAWSVLGDSRRRAWYDAMRNGEFAA